MGFYLPGIGEAIGGALRMQKQRELMDQVKGLMADESRPWSERAALVTAAHPELATNPEFQNMVTMGRQAEEDKYINNKRQREAADLAANDQFKALVDAAEPDARQKLIDANPDMAKRVFPALYEQSVAAKTAAEEQQTWLERAGIKDRYEDENRAAEQAFQAGQNALTREVTAAARPIVETPAQKQEQALSTDLAKKRQTVQVAEETQRAAVPGFIAELEGYKKLGSEYGGETFGTTAATISRRRTALATALAKQMAGPGMATNKQDVEDAKELIPEPGYFTSSASFEAAIDEIIRQQRAKLIGSQGVTVD